MSNNGNCFNGKSIKRVAVKKMFKSTEQFDKTMIKVLLEIQNGNTTFFNQFDDYSDLDIADVTQRAIDLGYILGLKVKIGAQDDVTYSGTGRLSYEGLQALE
jgi:hypothetical protein